MCASLQHDRCAGVHNCEENRVSVSQLVTNSSLSRSVTSWSPPPPLVGLFSDLSLHRSCICYHNYNEFVHLCNYLVVPRKFCFLVPLLCNHGREWRSSAPCLWFLHSFYPLLCCDFWALGREGVIKISIPLRDDHSSLSSLHLVLLKSLCYRVLIIIYAKKLHWRGLRGPLIYRCDDKFSGLSLILCPFCRITVVVSVPRAYGLSSHSFLVLVIVPSMSSTVYSMH